MPGQLRVGVVGIGFGKSVHVPAFRRDARVEVTAICASTMERAQEAAQAVGIEKAYGDWRKMLDDANIDAISIATPPQLQSEIVLAALNCGKAVFCEKPLAHSLESARQMARLARDKNLANIIDFEFSELTVFQKAKEILRSGSIGDVNHASITWQVETYANRMGLSSWRTDEGPGGGALNVFASHTLYYLEWLMGPVEELRCTLGAPPGYKGTGDTYVSLACRMASGALAAITVSTASPLGSGHRLEFYGQEGALVLSNGEADYMKGFRLLRGTRKDAKLEPVDAGSDGFDDKDGRILIVSKVAKRFIDWALHGKEARPNLEDGLRVQGLIDAARRSHKGASWTSVAGIEAVAGIQ